MDKIEELRYLIKAADREGEDIYRKMLASLQITPSQNEVLKILSFKDGLSISEIGELLICGSDSPSRIVQRLIDKEYVVKKVNPKDVRKSAIHLTRSGAAILKEATKIEDQFNAHIKTLLADQIDINLLINVLTKQIEGTKTEQQINQRKKF
ncbi:MarR family winged helix-turn-helix transcriptional regulator [Listeria valentina]|uniref:MarR family winged helix-turn-helix transcriptional regulator n=1 Tax=Listeria valentina TaxID=2705293 RepID=UPI00142F83AD|nr:winged helix DNA-binding protein [Listeria valentina]